MADVLSAAEFDTQTASGVALIDFYTPTCPPCRQIAPLIDQLAEEYAGKATVAKVDAAEEADLAARFDVRSVPTLLVLKDGEVVARMVGAQTKPALAEAIDSALEGPKLEW